MLIRGPVPIPYTIFQHSFQLTFRKRRMVSSLLLLFHALEMYSYSLSFHMTTFALFLSWENPINCSSIVFNYRNTSFVIKFKPFPALTDNTIQQFQISKPYKKSL